MAADQQRPDSTVPLDAFFLGSAKVKLTDLRLAEPPGRERLIIQKPRIDKLVRRFDSNGCDRLPRANRISALISRELLEETLSKSGYGSIAQLIATPLTDASFILDLPERTSLLYYDGQARIEAARRYLRRQHDRWWAVDLYDQNSGARFAISQRARNNESTRNAAGVVLREYLELVNRRDYAEAKKVALGFSTEESKEAESITKRPSLMEAFLSLKHISGLWTTLKGGLWRSGERGNDPELIHYLHFMEKFYEDFWKDIIGDQNTSIEFDSQTIELLESRAPGRSYQDRKHVKLHMENKMLFLAVQDDLTRERLERKLLSIKELIPSLTTYSRDTMHLHEIFKVLKLLLDPEALRALKRSKGPDLHSITSALQDIWLGSRVSNVVHLEDKEDGNIVKLTLKSGEFDCFQVQLQSLILFAMRNYTSLINVSAKTAPGHKKASITEPNPRCLYLFSKTARALGFCSDQIDVLLQIDYIRQLLEQFLEKAAPREHWLYDFKAAVDRLYVEFQHIIMEKRYQYSSESHNDTEVRLHHRCGRPLDEDLTQANNNLFLINIATEAGLQERGVTSSFVRREFFRRFWNPPQLIEGQFSLEVEMSENTVGGPPQRLSKSASQLEGATEIRSHEDMENLRRELAAAKEEIENLRNMRYETAAKEQEVLMDSASEYSDDNPIAVERGLREEQARDNELKQTQDLIAQYASQLAKSKEESTKLLNANALIKELEARIVGNENGAQRLHQEDLARERDLLGQTAKLENDNQLKDTSIKELEARIASSAESDQKLHDKDQSGREVAFLAREKSLEGQIEEQEGIIEAMQRQNDDSIRRQNELEASEATLKLKLEELKKQISVGTDQVLSLETELSNIKQREWYRAPGDDAKRENYQTQLEQQIQNHRTDLLTAIADRESREESEAQINSNIKSLTNPKSVNASPFVKIGQASQLKDMQQRSTDLKRDILTLTDIKIPAKENLLIRAEFDLLELKGGDALFFETDPLPGKENPVRVPIKAADLEKKFKDLLRENSSAWCFIDKRQFQMDLGDSLQWRRYLAHPPTVDNASFFVKSRKHASNAMTEAVKDPKRLQLSNNT